MHHNTQQIIQTFEIFREAIDLATERAIIQISGLESRNMPDNILPVKNVPYVWLLNKVSLVVHHFGFGTTAEVLKAGLPSIPVPHIFDHYKLANKLHRSGVAHKPLNLHKLTARHLAAAITNTKKDIRMKERLSGVSKAILKEKGLQNAVDLIEKHFNIQ